MFGFIKKLFFLTRQFLDAMQCVSMNNQECKIRTEIINFNSSEPSLYPYSINVNKCIGSCNKIDDPYARLCVSDVVKDMNIKVFNLMSRTYETRHIEWHETCICRCRLNAIVIINNPGIKINVDENAKN